MAAIYHGGDWLHGDIPSPVGRFEACCTTVMLKDTGSNLTMCYFSSNLNRGKHIPDFNF